MSSGRWVHADDFTGGVVVFCALCGRKRTRKSFHSGGTNYAEARRLATAYHWEHANSPEHRAALVAFHADPPPLNQSEELLANIFGKPPTDDDLRRRAARDAFQRVTLERAKC